MAHDPLGEAHVEVKGTVTSTRWPRAASAEATSGGNRDSMRKVCGSSPRSVAREPSGALPPPLDPQASIHDSGEDIEQGLGLSVSAAGAVTSTG
jgi:hypothetical protein